MRIQENALTYSKWWYILVRKGQHHLKWNFFRLLLLKGRLLTWDILIMRGWVGRRSFFLCQMDEESTAHFFIHCPSVIYIWKLFFFLF